jgi:hypothetical protein
MPAAWRHCSRFWRGKNSEGFDESQTLWPVSELRFLWPQQRERLNWQLNLAENSILMLKHGEE